MFGDQGTEPSDKAKDRLPSDKDLNPDEDARVNDEDGDSHSGVRRLQSERPSTADDMKNPRTGPIG